MQRSNLTEQGFEIRAERIRLLKDDRERTWGAVEMFLRKRDPHGVIDMLMEIQIIDRSISELEALG